MTALCLHQGGGVLISASVHYRTAGGSEGRQGRWRGGLGFDLRARTRTGMCPKRPSFSGVRSDHSGLCAGGRWWFVGLASAAVWGRGAPGTVAVVVATTV